MGGIPLPLCHHFDEPDEGVEEKSLDCVEYLV